MSVARITEYLDVDFDSGRWACHKCGQQLNSAQESYKKGSLVYERNPEEIYPPVFGSEAPYNLTTKPGYGVFVEFYCPGCGVMFENELLPDGYPPTRDIELDLDALRARHSGDDAGKES